MRRLLPALIALVLTLALAGCAGYTLGPTNGIVAGSRTIAVFPFVNTTAEPRISEYLNASMRRQFQQDGTFRLQTSGSPDYQVTGQITRFERRELSYATNDVLTPQEYTLVLTAQVVAVDNATGRTNLNRAVQGRTFIRAGTDLASSEREAMPILTDDLARNAVSLLVDGSW
jgi:hypothetical protein